MLERLGNYTYIECELETGRTHQIRVHMASIGHPILGDDVYGPAKMSVSFGGADAAMQRSWGSRNPATGEYMEFDAPAPGVLYEAFKVHCGKRSKKSENMDCIIRIICI